MPFKIMMMMILRRSIMPCKLVISKPENKVKANQVVKNNARVKQEH